MTHASLRDFIKQLEKKNQLVRIKTPVSNHLEITEIQKRITAQNKSAVIFENVIDKNGKPYKMPIVSNLYSSIDRIKLGLGTDNLQELGEMLAFLRQPTPPSGIKDAISMIPAYKNTLNMKPKTVSKAPCQEVVLTGDEVDLFQIPIQYCHPNEPAPLITWGLVVTKPCGVGGVAPPPQPSPLKGEGVTAECEAKTPTPALPPKGGGSENVAVYRMQVLSKNKTIMRWLSHRGGARHFLTWQKAGIKKMPVAVVIGADPATTIAATTPVPETISEYEYSGLLRGKKLELVNCKTIPLQVPANAEIILEGHVLTDEVHEEGPFGDHTGYYNSVEKFPVFEISAITMRKDAIYHTTHMGRPPDEPSVIGQALNEMFVPILKKQFPEIVDFWLPPEACSYRIAVISIKKEFPAHAKRIMMGVWSYLRQFMYTKFVIVVDDDIDCRNWADVMWALATRVDPARDSIIIENTPIDYLDFASPKRSIGSKIGIDATNKSYPEVDRTWGTPITMTDDIIRRVNEKWGDLGL